MQSYAPRLRFAYAFVWALKILAGCSQQEGALTQVIVVVDADESVAAHLTSATIEIYDPYAVEKNGRVEPASGPVTAPSRSGRVLFPFSVGVGKATADSFLIVVTGYEGERRVVERKARVEFTKGQTRGCGLYLASPCYGALCQSPTSHAWLSSTCRAESGECEEPETLGTRPVVAGAEFEAGLVTIPVPGTHDAGQIDLDHQFGRDAFDGSWQGGSNDAGRGLEDAGADASAPTVDEARPDLDAGRSDPDAGRSDLDAGRSDLDAGRSDLDAGRPDSAQPDSGAEACVRVANMSTRIEWERGSTKPALDAKRRPLDGFQSVAGDPPVVYLLEHPDGAADERVVALDALTGEEKWSHLRGNFGTTTPAFFGTGSDALIVLLDRVATNHLQIRFVNAMTAQVVHSIDHDQFPSDGTVFSLTLEQLAGDLQPEVIFPIQGQSARNHFNVFLPNGIFILDLPASETPGTRISSLVVGPLVASSSQAKIAYVDGADLHVVDYASGSVVSGYPATHGSGLYASDPVAFPANEGGYVLAYHEFDERNLRLIASRPDAAGGAPLGWNYFAVQDANLLVSDQGAVGRTSDGGGLLYAVAAVVDANGGRSLKVFTLGADRKLGAHDVPDFVEPSVDRVFAPLFIRANCTPLLLVTTNRKILALDLATGTISFRITISADETIVSGPRIFRPLDGKLRIVFSVSRLDAVSVRTVAIDAPSSRGDWEEPAGNGNHTRVFRALQ